MVKSIFYKEWLKIRGFLISYTLLSLGMSVYIFLSLKHGFSFSGGKNMWNDILFLGEQFFRPMKFVPLAGGILIAIAQYLPETVNKRLKLTFHLPMSENKSVMLMHLFGFLGLFAALSVVFISFVIVTAKFFPAEIVADCIWSVSPWFLAGIGSYFLVALVILEPIWISKFIYLLIGSFFLSFFLLSPKTASYRPAAGVLLLFTVILLVAILLPAYKFRKGEM